MLKLVLLTSSLVTVTSVSIVEPIDGKTYDGNWLPFLAIVENENEVPDSVHYSLNGADAVPVPRLNTDWPTYMQNYQNHGFSESPAPLTSEIFWAAPVTGYDHEFPTPVVVDGLVYYPQNIWGDTLFVLDAATGNIEWYFPGVGSTDDAVTVLDGFVYTASDSIFCFNSLTGDLVWANGDANHGGSTPLVIDGRVYCGINFLLRRPPDHDTGSDSLIYSDFENNVLCLDADTGEEIWKDTLPNLQSSCMAYWDGMIFVPTSKYNGFAPLYALSAETGDIIWENSDSFHGYHDSSPVIVDGIIYINGSGGYTLGIDAETGITVWSVQTSAYGMTATPAYHDQRLYFANEDLTYYCLGSASGSTIWTHEGTRQHGSSGIADGTVFYGESISFGSPDSSRVVALDCETGSEIWSFATICGPYAGFQSSPSITDGVMYYACTDGYLYAFGTGLKYTYTEDCFYADLGSNELIVTSWDEGTAAAADTILFSVTQTGIALESSTRLRLSAHPNPLYGSTSISFELAESGPVAVQVFDLTGRIVTELGISNGVQGMNSIQWNGCGDNGQSLSPGLYLCRIECDSSVGTTGLCLLK